LIIEALKNISQTHILHLDSYDVMFNQQDLSKITDTLTEDKIIFNAEKNFYNVIKNSSVKEDIKLTFNKFYDNKTYKYLNAGCFLGSKEKILYFFEELFKLTNNPSTEFYKLPCDQAAIQLYWYLYDNTYKTNNSIIKLDNDCDLFMCMNYLLSTEIKII
jgi:hypothetical protein